MHSGAGPVRTQSRARIECDIQWGAGAEGGEQVRELSDQPAGVERESALLVAPVATPCPTPTRAFRTQFGSESLALAAESRLHHRLPVNCDCRFIVEK